MVRLTVQLLKRFSVVVEIVVNSTKEGLVNFVVLTDDRQTIWCYGMTAKCVYMHA